MSRFDLLCPLEKETVTHYGLLCVALLWFVCFARTRGEAVTCYGLLCIASLCIALLCIVLHCSVVE